MFDNAENQETLKISEGAEKCRSIKDFHPCIIKLSVIDS